MKPDASLILVWQVATLEARRACAPSIGPRHFWLGLLKVCDESFAFNLDKMEIDGDERESVLSTGRQVRKYLEMESGSMAEVRHKLRSELGINPDQHFPSASKKSMHRSETMRLAFAKAQEIAAEQKTESLTAFHLVVALFELDLLDIKDCR